VNTEIGGDVEILRFDKTDSVPIRVVINIFQFIQNCKAVFAGFFVIFLKII